MRKQRINLRARLLIWIALLSTSFASMLLLPSSAQASSSYDSYVATTGRLEIWSNQTFYPCTSSTYQHDWSRDWKSLILDDQFWGFGNQAQYQSGYAQAFEDSLDTGGWAVLNQYDDGSDKNKGVVLSIAYSPSGLQANWSASGASLTSKDSSDLYVVTFQVFQNGGCQPRAWQPTRQGLAWFGYSGNTTVKTFLVAGDVDMNEPSGYEGITPPSATPAARYVAMGDSFSSGEGNSLFEYGTDENGVNECHRSPRAYPRLLQNDLDLGTTAFVPCSGATTSNVLYGGSADGAWGEPPQIDALSLDTEVVTITIGGNDVGFKAFATACTVGSCDFATTAYSDIHGKIVNDLPGELADVYEAIDGATSSTADIYVVGYPQIAPAEMPTGPNSACYPFNGGADNPDSELNDGATAYAVVSELNSVIDDAVTDMNSAKFHFVDPNLSGSPFIGHDWCQQDRYFVQIGIPIPPSNTEYSFHPNMDGHEAYKTIIGGEIS